MPTKTELDAAAAARILELQTQEITLLPQRLALAAAEGKYRLFYTVAEQNPQLEAYCTTNSLGFTFIPVDQSLYYDSPFTFSNDELNGNPGYEITW
jgi:hypothetical protein